MYNVNVSEYRVIAKPILERNIWFEIFLCEIIAH